MKKTHFLLIIVFCSTLFFCNLKSKHDKYKNFKKNVKCNAVNVMNVIYKEYNHEKIKKYFHEDFIPGIATSHQGFEFFENLIPKFKAAKSSHTSHRVFQDSSYVIMHNSYENTNDFHGPKKVVAFDIWKFENRKISEHIFAIDIVKGKNGSGRTQTDGYTKLVDLEKVFENKQLVKNYIEDVFINENYSKLSNYISSKKYHEHNSLFKDGLEGLKESITELVNQNMMFEYTDLINIWGEGNFVLTRCMGVWHDRPFMYYDLFNISEGKIVEHWDIREEAGYN